MDGEENVRSTKISNEGSGISGSPSLRAPSTSMVRALGRDSILIKRCLKKMREKNVLRSQLCNFYKALQKCNSLIAQTTFLFRVPLASSNSSPTSSIFKIWTQANHILFLRISTHFQKQDSKIICFRNSTNSCSISTASLDIIHKTRHKKMNLIKYQTERYITKTPTVHLIYYTY